MSKKGNVESHPVSGIREISQLDGRDKLLF